MTHQERAKAPPRRCACGGIVGPDGECARCRAGRLARQALSSPGTPLDPATRALFEPRLGADLADVRLHRDHAAARSAAALGARAYTVGSDIVLGAGDHEPRLLAHELAHVLQQRGGTPSPQATLEVGPADDPLERAADRVADGVLADRDVGHELRHVARRRGAAALLQRQMQPTCAGVPFDPASERCCRDTIQPGAAKTGAADCAETTTRDVEYDGCSVPDWLPDWIITPDRKDNPGGAEDTWFSDPSIHGTQPRSFVPKLPCDVHDKCFQTCGADRSQCDQALISAAWGVCMMSRRAPVGSPAYEQCMLAVDRARTWLPYNTGDAFDQRQREYCACCSTQSLPAKTRAELRVRFPTGSTTPEPTSLGEIEMFANANAAALAAKTSRLTVIGQASRLGSEADNIRLSAERLDVVYRLIAARIPGGFTGDLVPVPLGEGLAATDPTLHPADDSPDYRVVDVLLEGF